MAQAIPWSDIFEYRGGKLYNKTTRRGRAKAATEARRVAEQQHNFSSRHGK